MRIFKNKKAELIKIILWGNYMKLKYFVTIFIIVHTITAAKLLYNNEDIQDTLTKEFNKKVNN